MAAHQAPPSLGFSRQEQWSGLPFPSPMHGSEKWKWSCSVVPNPQRPHGLQPSRLLCPWDFPGKSTGVGCHCLLRGIQIIVHKTNREYYNPIKHTRDWDAQKRKEKKKKRRKAAAADGDDKLKKSRKDILQRHEWRFKVNKECLDTLGRQVIGARFTKASRIIEFSSGMELRCHLSEGAKKSLL